MGGCLQSSYSTTVHKELYNHSINVLSPYQQAVYHKGGCIQLTVPGTYMTGNIPSPLSNSSMTGKLQTMESDTIYVVR
jgi:hypothetical protein